MTLVIVGGSGFLGGELVRQAVAAGRETVATYASRPGDAPASDWRPLDVRDTGQLDRLLAGLAPCTLVNAAGGHADWAVTADGAARVAQAAARHGCRLVHVSSDAVFSGDRAEYDERCLPDPVTPYGAAKAAAETAVRLLTPDAVVARTSLILGDGDSVHERHVHDLATGRRTGVLYTDVVRCPVHVADLAAALLELAASTASGVHHLAGPDALTRYDLGILIARRDALDPARLPAGRHADAPRPGPLTLRLNSETTRSRLRTRLRGAREFLTGAGAP
ncbi:MULTISPECIES: sugar nucleotide-binding protein [unclassified Streptomyces]|jgi:dTDP-4-dehydrorhamnose reductase|uniref:Sugar nucleotide-binding protein n=2 Tax=Streptomyces TaxID=1883 RepID=A0ABV5VHS0_9ACTN